MYLKTLTFLFSKTTNHTKRMHTADINMNKYFPNMNEQTVICLRDTVRKIKADFSSSDQSSLQGETPKMPVNINYWVCQRVANHVYYARMGADQLRSDVNLNLDRKSCRDCR